MCESNALRIPFIAVFVLSFFLASFGLEAQQNQNAIPPDYRISPGDVLQIDVWKQPEISRTIPVKPDGMIDVPLTKDVKASGLTAMQLADLLRNKLKAKIPNVQVTVTVAVGELNHPQFLPGRSSPPGILPLLTPVPIRDLPSPERLRDTGVPREGR